MQKFSYGDRKDIKGPTAFLEVEAVKDGNKVAKIAMRNAGGKRVLMKLDPWRVKKMIAELVDSL